MSVYQPERYIGRRIMFSRPANPELPDLSGYPDELIGNVTAYRNRELFTCDEGHDTFRDDYCSICGRNVRPYRHWTEFTVVADRNQPGFHLEGRTVFTLQDREWLDRNGYCALHSGGELVGPGERTPIQSICPNPHDHCVHGTYVGGCGIDWMCGPCEMGVEWDDYLEHLDHQRRQYERDRFFNELYANFNRHCEDFKNLGLGDVALNVVLLARAPRAGHKWIYANPIEVPMTDWGSKREVV